MGMIDVVVVDDSALVRSLLAAIIDAQPDMRCVGAASDPYVAREMIRRLDPAVITLDVEMPRMDGLDFLERLMRLRPTPVVMVSTLTERGAETTLRALELGAVDFVAKPRIGISQGLHDAAGEIVEKIRAAARARVRRLAPVGRDGEPPRPSVPARRAGLSRGTERLVAIGASTGGTEAIREILVAMPPDCPAIVITQHMPPGFTRSFASRLDRLCRIQVKEGEPDERVLTGHAYIAPGGTQMRVVRSGSDYVLEVTDEPPVNRHKPSVDVLFRSVAHCAGANAVGIILTGMGRDGADGLREMREGGSWTIAQDEATCIVYGMPREAVAAGAAAVVLPLPRIADALLEHLRQTDGFVNRV
jgi:two-component system chemotaxis response regulator CheB